MAHHGALPKVHRFITTHNSEGKAVFSDAFDEESKIDALPDDMGFALSYSTQGFPVDLNSDADLKVYDKYLNSAPGLVISNGTVLRHVDFQPGITCAMHRTVSLDYGVVLEGEVEAVLDSGETRLLKRGDVCIQRGTMHAWRNTSKDNWARMMFVLQECKPLELGGQKLGEELDTIVGVRSSS
ncbi:cupin domain-containing protein [Aulographum hederae CBS 113979]|uniref:Cupin domain-containing protein n=1 Tax=Aulographum hederae CBS 113979 TaxID=1176131 RepID=A0A6G1HF45_9PEZI|nr:cupin domain-containing protein [Aulographum hederae CBS 113979]